MGSLMTWTIVVSVFIGSAYADKSCKENKMYVKVVLTLF